ncbi:MAG TPA: DUF1697 domain-containing protein [Terriglobales bacterium]|nr:DUF1697 domain-containing protein [Terriglobales bacterium]
MPVFISMLRGVNVGGHNKVNMTELSALYESLGFDTPRTYVQSGNVIFRTSEKNAASIAKKIQDGIERTFGFRPAVVLRTAPELKKAIDANPFAGRRDIVPGKLLVTFLASDPGPDGLRRLAAFKSHPEELHLNGSELYIYFPNGAGRSKLPWSSVEKLVGVTGTARNWNSVSKILEIAVELAES